MFALRNCTVLLTTYISKSFKCLLLFLSMYTGIVIYIITYEVWKWNVAKQSKVRAMKSKPRSVYTHNALRKNSKLRTREAVLWCTCTVNVWYLSLFSPIHKYIWETVESTVYKSEYQCLPCIFHCGYLLCFGENWT